MKLLYYKNFLILEADQLYRWRTFDTSFEEIKEICYKYFIVSNSWFSGLLLEGDLTHILTILSTYYNQYEIL